MPLAGRRTTTGQSATFACQWSCIFAAASRSAELRRRREEHRPEAIARALRNSKAPRSEDAHAAAKIAAIPVGQYVTDEEQIMAIVRYLAA